MDFWVFELLILSFAFGLSKDIYKPLIHSMNEFESESLPLNLSSYSIPSWTSGEIRSACRVRFGLFSSIWDEHERTILNYKIDIAIALIFNSLVVKRDCSQIRKLPIYGWNRWDHVVITYLILDQMLPYFPCKHCRVIMLVFCYCFHHWNYSLNF